MSKRFEAGAILITPGAQGALSREDVVGALRRHLQGDWGEVCDEDARQNEWALDNDARLFSVYLGQNQTKFWIITEADRSATTVLLPDEY